MNSRLFRDRSPWLRPVRAIFAAWLLLATCNGVFGAQGAKELPASVWSQLLALPGIDVKTRSDDRVQAVIFFDPNCPMSARLWERLYGNKSAYRGVVTRWVPVAYFNAQSAGKAAFLLASGSSASLAANFTGFDFAHCQGAATEVQVSPQLSSQIAKNSVSWRQLGAATPIMVIMRKDGTALAQIGMPLEPEFATMMQSLHDARLADFR